MNITAIVLTLFVTMQLQSRVCPYTHNASVTFHHQIKKLAQCYFVLSVTLGLYSLKTSQSHGYRM